VFTFINEERTRELQAMPKYAKFNKWLRANGVKHPGVDSPVAFGKQGQLVGMAARKDIPPMTAFVYVPYKLIITEATVMRSPISHIVQKHPKVFKQHYDSEYLMLASFVFHEFLKGEESFWHDYFEIINFSDIPLLWTEDEVDELQD
jgi:hypothetical protein